jgi:hypothetical protein
MISTAPTVIAIGYRGGRQTARGARSGQQPTFGSSNLEVRTLVPEMLNIIPAIAIA